MLLVNHWQGEKMNQPLFVPTILTVKASEDLQKSVAKDLEKTQEISISELLHDKKEEEDNKTEITERN
jgi:hypothetical protein